MDAAYIELAKRLRLAIANGEYPPGSFLPAEVTLQERENLARGTVHRAIEELVSEGLVVYVRSRGNQVRLSKPLIWRASDPERNDGNTEGPSDVWSRNVREQGYEPSEEIRAEVDFASERIAKALHLEPGEPVVIRRRLRLVDGVNYHTADSFYPRSIVVGTEVELPSHVQPGVYAVFERLGRPWVRTTDRFTARAPTREETTLLGIPRGVAVAEVARRSFDAAGVPVRLSLFVLPGDRHTIEYEHGEAAT